MSSDLNSQVAAADAALLAHLRRGDVLGSELAALRGLFLLAAPPAADFASRLFALLDAGQQHCSALRTVCCSIAVSFPVPAGWSACGRLCLAPVCPARCRSACINAPHDTLHVRCSITSVLLSTLDLDECAQEAGLCHVTCSKLASEALISVSCLP